MAQVEIRINGRDYRIACEDGQESHLSNLAKYLDGKVGELVDEVGQIGDTSLMVMAGLLVTDELSDTREELEAFRNQTARETQSAIDNTEDKLASQIDALATRIEQVADALAGDGSQN
ncbi:MAG: cell division protein ZapA [Alphaproteobacteria bacterium]|nr:cell division protein ZapA [Alphaproteobacteria bacterium]